jgi:acetyltransferase-like isoleucine patch superfamily enzyme
MEFLPLRDVALPEATERAYDRWVGAIADRLDSGADRNELAREVLTQIYYPQYLDTDPSDLPPATRIALLQMDPRNVTLEPEYYRDIDVERYARVKPLQWLWEMFDKSPLGENVHLGVKLRRVLARHIFRSVGRIAIGNGASVSDYANVYSHSHALADGRFVTAPKTIIGAGVRITYHATVLAGVHLEADAMLGSMAVATRDVEGGKVALGIPAQPKLDKPPREKRPDAPPTGDPLDDDA